MYGFSIKTGRSMDEAVTDVTAALKEQGFGVLTEIDVQATLKAKLDLDRRPYRILGACNPALASQALEADPDIGLLLPCNVVVRQEEDGSVTVAFMDPVAVLNLVDQPGVEELATEVRGRLQQVMQVLQDQDRNGMER